MAVRVLMTAEGNGLDRAHGGSENGTATSRGRRFDMVWCSCVGTVLTLCVGIAG
jgi:hypothetical protein